MSAVLSPASYSFNAAMISPSVCTFFGMSIPPRPCFRGPQLPSSLEFWLVQLLGFGSPTRASRAIPRTTALSEGNRYHVPLFFNVPRSKRRPAAQLGTAMCRARHGIRKRTTHSTTPVAKSRKNFLVEPLGGMQYQARGAPSNRPMPVASRACGPKTAVAMMEGKNNTNTFTATVANGTRSSGSGTCSSVFAVMTCPRPEWQMVSARRFSPDRAPKAKTSRTILRLDCSHKSTGQQIAYRCRTSLRMSSLSTQHARLP